MREHRRTIWLSLIGVIVFGAALRLYGLTFGLPAVYNPDESPILNRALAFAKGDLNPHNFLYPSLYFYALFVWEGLFFLCGRVVGLYHSLGDFQREFFTNPWRLFLAGRLLTAVVGTLTIPALFVMGRRMFGSGVGLAAALFLAAAPIAARDAHYVKLDVPVTFWLVMTYVVLASLFTEPRRRRRATWLTAGFFAGLTVSTHYYAAFIVLPVTAAAVMEGFESGWTAAAGHLWWAGLAAIGGFLAGTPFILVEPAVALHDMIAVRQIDVDRATVHGAFVSLRPYLQLLMWDAVGWPVFLAGVAGMIWITVVKWRLGVLLASFVIPFLAFVSNTVPETRYLNVLLPLICVAAAYAVVELCRRVVPGKPLAAAVMVLLVATPGAIAAIRTDRFISQTDTRTLGLRFLEDHARPGATILVQPYSVPLHPTREALIEALRSNLGSERRATIKFQLQLAATPWPSPSYRPIYLGRGGEDADKLYIDPARFKQEGDEPLRAFGVEYVVLKRYNDDDPAIEPLLDVLRRVGEVAATFTPYRDGRSGARTAPFLHNTAARISPDLTRPGPIIEIWRIH